VRSRLLTVLVVVGCLVLQLRVVAADPDRLPTPGRPWILAVGDSITAGYTRDLGFDGPAHSWAVQLRRRLSAGGTPWELYSLACPGETTVTYREGGCIGRDLVPALDGRSQRDGVADAIRRRGDSLRLIVVELAVNDYFRARTKGGDVDAQLDAAALRLDAIVADLEHIAPGVPVVLADIYDPHGLSDSWAQAVHLDARIAAVAARRGAALADFLHAVDRPLALPEDRCQLIDCAHHDIHPTLAGQTALYDAVVAALPPGLLP
jgi:lysophospholipase L1-like esterase